jgi:hypothetical protein
MEEGLSDQRSKELERAYAMYIAAIDAPPSGNDYPFGRLQGLGDAWIEIQMLLEQREGTGE